MKAQTTLTTDGRIDRIEICPETPAEADQLAQLKCTPLNASLARFAIFTPTDKDGVRSIPKTGGGMTIVVRPG